MRRTLHHARAIHGAISALFAVALLAAACGPKDDGGPSRTTPRPAPPEDERPFVTPRSAAGPDLDEGKRHIRAGSFAAALAFFEAAVKQHPTDSRPAFYRAVCLYNLKRSQEAVQAYLTAAKLKPPFYELFLNLGSALIVTNQPKRAVRALERALQFQPRAADAWLNLGVAHEEAKDLPAAARALEKAVTYGPTRADTHLALADVLRKMGRHAAAAKAYAEADQRAPGDLYTLLGMAVSLAKSNQGPAAEQALAKARKIKPGSLRVLMAAGLIYGMLGRHAEAAKAYAEALKQKADHPGLLLLLGRAELETRRFAAALAALQKAKAAGRGKLPTVDFWLAEAHRRAGRCAKAKPLYRAFLKTTPKGALADQAAAHLKRCRR